MEPTALPPFEQELFRLIVKYYGDPDLPFKSKVKYDEIMSSLDKVMIIYALIKKNGNIFQSAASLNINRNTMRKMSAKLNVVPKWFMFERQYCPRIKMGIL